MKYDQLLLNHQRALERIMIAIHDAISELDDPSVGRWPRTNAPTTIGSRRNSRVIFLTGARGTGKSTLLQTAISAFENKEKPEHDVNKMVGSIRNRVLWLEDLDMEPLPKPTNLLAAILARVEQAAKHHRPHLLARPLDANDPLIQLQRLKTDVAIAWEGNLLDRAGRLDPDHYAIELFKAESSKLGFNDRLNAVLDGLAKDYFRESDLYDPLFILPVDDVDMNPPRCLELLRLLRMMATPRLVTVVVGDVNLAEQMVKLNLAGELKRVYMNSGDGANSFEQETAKVAVELASNAMRKLVPPGQRIALTVARLEEALNYSPHPEEETRLRHLLERARIDLEGFPPAQSGMIGARMVAGTPVNNLLEFLLSPAPINSEKVLPESVPYSGSRALRARARQLADLWMAFDAAAPQSSQGERPQIPAETTEEIIASETIRAIREAADLSPEVRDALLEAIELRESGPELDTSIFDIEFLGKTVRTFGYSDRRVELRIPQTHRFKVSSTASATSRRTREIGAIEGSVLPYLTLLHDLLALKAVGGTVGAGSTPPWIPWAVTCWPIPHEENPIEIYWRTPRWSSVWAFEQHAYYWREVVEETTRAVAAKEMAVETVAFAWIESCSALLTPRPRRGSGRLFKDELDWEYLCSLVTEATTPLGDHSAAVNVRIGPLPALQQSWLVNLGLMLSPEWGLPDNVAKNLAPTLNKLLSRSAVSADTIRAKRTEMGEIFAKAEAKDLWRDLVSRQHPMNRIQKGRLRPILKNREPKHKATPSARDG